jgi:hypothetical protein
MSSRRRHPAFTTSPGRSIRPARCRWTDTNPMNGERGQQKLNSVDYNPLLRALLVRLDRWVSDGAEPPSSRYPRLADGTAVAPAALKGAFAAIPGVGFPAHPPQVTRVDFGPEAAKGIATILPPADGEPYPHFVPAVDADGNEVTGIHLPPIAVPLGTFTGWNVYRAQPLELADRDGSLIAFAGTRAEREAADDPRPSLEERYGSRDAYAAQVEAAAAALVAERLLLPSDAEAFVETARRCDRF